MERSKYFSAFNMGYGVGVSAAEGNYLVHSYSGIDGWLTIG
jgi:hypothetical protein